LRIHGEIAPALLFAGKMKEELSGQSLVGYVIREALAKNWPVPENLRIITDGIAMKGEFERRDILVTKFKVLAIERSKGEALLEVLSQKANGDVFLEGQIKLIFPD
jgi:hypothetical protein